MSILERSSPRQGCVKNHIQEDLVAFLSQKLALKTKNSNLLTTLTQVLLQDIKKSFVGMQKKY